MPGNGAQYLAQMDDAGLMGSLYKDMRWELHLNRIFSVTGTGQDALSEESLTCQNPLLELTLEGLLSLGKTVAQGAFTFGRFATRKPA